jgi:Tol biopolymer transport system component
MQIRGWTPDGRAYKFSKRAAHARRALSGESSPFTTRKNGFRAVADAGFSIDEANRLGQAAAQQFNAAETQILINHNNDLWIYDAAAGSVKRLTNTMRDEELEADFSPDGAGSASCAA